MTYNIRRGGSGRAEFIAAVISACEPDLVVMQEATRPGIVESIAERTGMAEWRAYERQSLAFVSRRAVAHAAWHRPRFSRHAFIEIVPEGERVRIVGVHLSALHAAWTELRRQFELKALLRTIKAREEGFHVLAGDFNTLAPAETLDVSRLPPRVRPLIWLSGGRIRWRTIQTILSAGYIDAYRLHHALAPGHTLPTWDPHVRLDYVFTPKAFADRITRCDVVDHPDAVAASDHFPVVADLVC